MTPAYDDEIWMLVPVAAGPPPAHLVKLVRSLGAHQRVLDLGAGDGRLSAGLQAGELTLADVSEVALGRACERLPGARTALIEPDAPLPFEGNAFDLVLCAETIEHVRDVQGLLSEVRRVLRPGGKLAITTPAHRRLTGLAIAWRGFERCFDPLSPHLRFFTRRSLAVLLSEMGFEVVSLRTRTGMLLAVATR